jgi:hypothetical protein
MAVTSERRLSIAGQEILLRCRGLPGLDQLPPTYDAYPGTGAQPILVLELDRQKPFDPDGEVLPEHPAFIWKREKDGAISFARADATGSVRIPADGNAPVVATFSVSTLLHSLEAVLRLAASIALPRKDVLILHASAIEHDGVAWVFAGQSGAGKTTLSTLLSQHYEKLKLSDELLLLRLDQDVPRVSVSPFLCSRGLSHGSEVPLGSVYFLTHGPEHVRTELAPVVALRELMRHVLCYATTPETADQVLELSHRVTRSRPCHHLAFAPRTDVAQALGIA